MVRYKACYLVVTVIHECIQIAVYIVAGTMEQLLPDYITLLINGLQVLTRFNDIYMIYSDHV